MPGSMRVWQTMEAAGEDLTSRPPLTLGVRRSDPLVRSDRGRRPWHVAGLYKQLLRWRRS